MRYHAVLPISRGEAESAFATDDADRIIDALLSVTYYDPDWRWVQGWCLRLAKSPSVWVRRTAVTCLGHLARIHGILDMHIVQPVLDGLAKDPEVSGAVEDAWDDIEQFLKKRKKRSA